MDLDPGLWSRRDGSLRVVYRIYRAVANAVGTGRFWRLKSFEFADFSRRLLERMAIDDHFVGGAGAGGGGRLCAGVLPQAGVPGLRCRAGIDGVLPVAVASSGTGDGFGRAAR